MKKLLLALTLLPFIAAAEYHPPIQYGVAETVDFVLYNTDGTLDVDEVDSGTEVTVHCDGDAGTTATNDFVDEGSYYSIALTASETQCERITLDIGATDRNVVVITTFGNASAQNPEGLQAYHLDHAFAVDYDPASKPGVGTALFNELVENDGGVSRLTANALEQAPTGGGGTGTPTLADNTAQSGTASTIQLAASETFADDELNDNTVCINAGTGAGQCRVIDDYVSSTDTITVADNWTTNPDATSEYYVINGHINVASFNGAPVTQDLETAADVADAVRTEPCGTETADTFGDLICNDIETIAAEHSPQLLESTTIATLASQTSFTLTAGSGDDDAYNDAIVVVTDASTPTQKAVGTISDYTGSTLTVTLGADPGIFTMAVGDTIDVIAALGSATGDATSANQTTILNRLGVPSDLGGGATVANNLSDIEGQTDDIGVAGAGLTEAGGTGDQLTAVPWNAAWDAEIESEASDALIALQLDHIGEQVLYVGTCDSGTTTTCVDATLTQVDDYWRGVGIVFTSGTIDNQTSCVFDFVASSDTLNFRARTSAVSTNTYVLFASPLCEGVVSP